MVQLLGWEAAIRDIGKSVRCDGLRNAIFFWV